ncbi:MFS transporter [Occultella kanbiaonis]|uniref:MFS transporter n=1 Tax=Occultella kanbiaonis TaxID=2675754 RepID=UPI001F40187E|nr:MFS transporter [Occultella kanbiaonis]
MPSARLTRLPSPFALRPLRSPTAGAGILDALRVRNYRFYVSSQVLTSTCGWAARVAQDWLVLELSGSAALVGLTVALQFAPMLVFGLFGGVIADRYNRQRILTITQTLFGTFTLVVGILTLLGAVEVWHVLASALLGGMAIVVDNPARQAFIHEIAGPKLLRRAISLNTSVFQLGALIGPAFAAALIALVGNGWAFVANAIACWIAAFLIFRMRRSEMHLAPVVARAKGQLREGLAHVRSKPEILWACVLVGFVAITGVNMATVLAQYANEVVGAGASGYGLLTSTLAAGACTGAIFAGRARTLRLRTLVGGAAALGVLLLVASVLSVFWLFLVALFGVGLSCLLYLTRSNTLVQTSADPAMRGRVLSLYVLINMGAQAFSGLLIGWVAEHYGAHAGLAACAIGPLLGVAVVGTILARRGDLKPVLRLRNRPGRGFVYVVPRVHGASAVSAAPVAPLAAVAGPAPEAGLDVPAPLVAEVVEEVEAPVAAVATGATAERASVERVTDPEPVAESERLAGPVPVVELGALAGAESFGENSSIDGRRSHADADAESLEDLRPVAGTEPFVDSKPFDEGEPLHGRSPFDDLDPFDEAPHAHGARRRRVPAGL